MKRNIFVTVFRDTVSYLPQVATDFMKMLSDKMALIPKEYIETAIIEIETESYYDSCTAFLSLTYTRPENDSEEAAREADERQKLADTEAREKAQLEKLLLKYKTKED